MLACIRQTSSSTNKTDLKLKKETNHSDIYDSYTSTIKGQPAKAMLNSDRSFEMVQGKLSKNNIYKKLTLYSYLSVSVDIGQIRKAHQTLSSMSRTVNALDVSHYNVVLRGYARLGSVAEMHKLQELMKKNKIKLNPESYTCFALGYSTMDPTEQPGMAKKLYRELKLHRIRPSSLFQQTYLNPDERKSVIRFMKLEDPNFEDEFCQEPSGYECKLLTKFEEAPSAPYDFSGISNLKCLTDWADYQRSIETKTSIDVKSVASSNIPAKRMKKYTEIWREYQIRWRKALEDTLDKDMELLREQSHGNKVVHIYPYLQSLDRPVLINMLLDEVEKNAARTSYSPSTKYLHQCLGDRIMRRYLMKKYQRDGSLAEINSAYDDYLRNYCTNPDLMSNINQRQYIQQRALETKNYAIYKEKLTFVDEWPNNILSSIGRFLYGILLREIKFDHKQIKSLFKNPSEKNLVNAFYTAYFQVDCTHKIKEELRCHEDFAELVFRVNSTNLRLDYSYLPCYSPPMPWLSRQVGGYLLNNSQLTRTGNHSAEANYFSRQLTGNQKLYPSLDSLNALGLCPWIVNRDILDLVIGLFRSGGDLSLNIPLHDDKFLEKQPILKNEANATAGEKAAYNKEKKKFDQRRREMYSLWRDCLLRLSIANHSKDRVFWSPHNMDFRGRTYPLAPHFNHLGNDLARSLLLFAKGCPLGDKGLDWLKIHAINLLGTMKRLPIDKRLEYANSILHLEILDSADNPLDGRRWWTRGEDKWQLLACCKEIAKAIRSRDHREYVSHFPVHQDGSCNGLQHYAALGRDPAGAQAVNLVPSPAPQDVYMSIVDIVETMRQRDEAKGMKVAKMLKGFVQRKTIKQTVMTTVYGVTKYGARQQIARQLLAKGYTENEIWQASNYLTAKTFDSIGQMFQKSRNIQDWFNSCAFIIASKGGKIVRWETPLGFTVSQPYMERFQFRSAMYASSNILDATQQQQQRQPTKVNSSKQKTAFPPNYIHSLDSSHMMLTSLFCQRLGITFVSIHDCFWTHAATVDAMNRICREQFIALHSEPLLEDLSRQFLERYAKLFKQKDHSKTKTKKLAKSSYELDDIETMSPELLESTDGDYVAPELLTPNNRSLVDLHDTKINLVNEECLAKLADIPKTGDFDLNVIRDSAYFFS